MGWPVVAGSKLGGDVMPIQNSPYANPGHGLRQGLESLADAFGPPSGTDLAGYATAGLNKTKRDQLVELFGAGNTASERAALTGVQGYGQTPQGFTYKVDEDNNTSRANNADDNRRQFASDMFPVLKQGDVRPAIPGDISSLFGIDVELPQLSGAPKPLTESEWAADQNERLRGGGQITDQMLVDAMLGDKSPVETMGPNGPIYMSPGEAVRTGASVAPKTPLVNIGPNGEPLGSPGDGLVWQRNADGTVVLDERGAPVAIPYQGGKVWQAEQDAAAAEVAGTAQTEVKANVVVQDIDRSLSAIEANPLMTTGVGAQVSGGIGGSPAADVAGLLNSVRANVGFDQLQAMRDASPTGGALGPVSDKENSLLQSVLGDVAQSQSDGQLKDNLKRLKNIYLDIIHGAGNGPPREQLSFESQQSGPEVGTVEDGFQFNGGDPADPASWSPVGAQ
jgi:hypothetical protein